MRLGYLFRIIKDMMRLPRFIRSLLYSFLFIGICILLVGIVPITPKTMPVVAALGVVSAKQLPVSPTLSPPALYIGVSVPSALRDETSKWNLLYADDPQAAAITLDLAKTDDANSVWVYALVAPFPTLTDDVSSRDLLDFWRGSGTGPFGGSPLRMAESTLRAFSAAWGEPTPGAVVTVAEDRLVDILWSETPSWGIVPFEKVEPRLKVLSVDQNSPIRSDFEQGNYPLVLRFQSSDPSFSLPATNRDPSKMTTVMLTGVTALVRNTAFKMERNGMTYPAQDIRDVLLSSDILHINNEVPFYSLCDVPNPNQTGLVFCSREKYMELLTYIDVDVMELSGDHFGDYGEQAMRETLQIYTDAGVPYYGGGANLEEARKPLLMGHNGNKIAFIGCNAKDAYAGADAVTSGAAPCDYDYMRQQIRALRAQGYVVIATFQYEEYTDPQAAPIQMEDFRWQAESGAQIVSGSQAHYAQVMEFYDNSFIHYGLGNLFFDQMGKTDGGIDNIRREFVDNHVIYNGQYISTEIHTFILMDYSRPRLMDAAERSKFLRYYFEQSGWVAGQSVNDE
jgi:poly-gamma-glutamate synthesis protein (capsule biosynthesis protein)